MKKIDGLDTLTCWSIYTFVQAVVCGFGFIFPTKNYFRQMQWSGMELKIVLRPRINWGHAFNATGMDFMWLLGIMVGVTLCMIQSEPPKAGIMVRSLKRNAFLQKWGHFRLWLAVDTYDTSTYNTNWEDYA